MKEEILLSYNVGKNSFDFLLETDGLVLTDSTYEVWKIDVYAQTTYEAYMNQRQVYPQD